MLSKNEFSTLDFIIFAITLVISLFIGIYNAIKNRYNQTTKEVFLAGGNMGVVPVALSLFASFMSSIAVIGVPAESYVFNTMYMWALPAFPIAIFLSAHVHIPVIYNLNLTSTYEVNLVFYRMFMTCRLMTSGRSTVYIDTINCACMAIDFVKYMFTIRN